jgi:GNAT superfamily N-acetyltransferase
MAIGFRQASDSDFESLLALRIVTMRPSLERLGRFDVARATERFRSSYDARWMRLILSEDQVLGCVSVRPINETEAWLEHFYIELAHQSRGVGATVLTMLFREADESRAALKIEVLKESAANGFYIRHGFVETHRGEWDIYYRREPIVNSGAVAAHSRPSAT